MTRTQTEEDPDNYHYSTDENYTELKDVVTCDGLTVRGDMYLDDDEILGSDLWDRDADSEEEGDFTGNESMPSTLRYHDTVVVIVPMSQVPSLLPKDDPGTALSFVASTLEHQPNDHHLQDSLLTILEDAVTRGSPNSTILSNVIDLAVKLQRTKLFGNAFSGTTEISLVILADALNKLDALIQDEDIKLSFENWKAPIAQKMVESKRALDMPDHDYLIILLFTRSGDLEWLANWFAPTLASKGSRFLISTILGEVYTNRDRKLFQNATHAYRCILERSNEKLALQARDFPSPYSSYSYRPLDKDSLDFKIIIKVISQGLDLGLSKEATGFIETSCNNIYKSCPETNANSILPATTIRGFLEALLTVLQKYKVPPLESVKNMFVALFRHVLIGKLPTRPVKLPGWKHKRIYCQENCNECRQLNSFLVDVNEQTREFAMATKKREHLQSHLRSNLFRCVTRTGRTPYVLVVTKLGKEFQEDMKEYERSLASIKNHLRPFQCVYVKSLLGEELYDELVLLKDESSADNSGMTRASGEKRKAEEELEGSSASRPKLIE
ncbi:uncharacterized protein F4812DRAFT_457426 [Daldinia caldariorum]|uniref:uncharacterized protein n=1 Tax=Daldinia caldariorum TaxID=326644 RepID=UPI002007CD3C|nr:uncharacterized protein F4812DRAFT_457426 [Daldinia caldariorum]KAI1470028.1 hypothetical protein F4812DRAFT_457426 [Daldinia caldariorum]